MKIFINKIIVDVILIDNCYSVKITGGFPNERDALTIRHLLTYAIHFIDENTHVYGSPITGCVGISNYDTNVCGTVKDIRSETVLRSMVNDIINARRLMLFNTIEVYRTGRCVKVALYDLHNVVEVSGSFLSEHDILTIKEMLRRMIHMIDKDTYVWEQNGEERYIVDELGGRVTIRSQGKEIYGYVDRAESAATLRKMVEQIKAIKCVKCN